MAIFSAFPGLAAHVIIGNRVRKEYDVPADSIEDTPTSVTKYIEAEDGTAFQIQLRFYRQFKYLNTDLCWRLRLDGKLVSETLLFKQSIVHNYIIAIGSVYVGSDDKCFAKKFMFSALTTNDDPVKAKDEKLKGQVQELGQITIELHRVVIGEVSSPYFRQVDASLDSVPEKALKGKSISRKTDLGPGVPTTPPVTRQVDWIDPVDKPFATFRFRYRSMDDLKSEFIVPRSQSPVPLEERPVESLTAEEMRELLTRQRTQTVRVKKEPKRDRFTTSSPRDDDDDDDDISIINQRATKRARTETIDLTDA